MFMRSIFSSLLPKKDSAISQLLKKKKIKNFVHFRRPRTKPDNSSYVLFGWISDWLWIYKSEQVFVILIYIQVNKSKVGTNFNLTHNYAFLFTGYTSHNNRVCLCTVNPRYMNTKEEFFFIISNFIFKIKCREKMSLILIHQLHSYLRAFFSFFYFDQKYLYLLSGILWYTFIFKF